MDPITIASLIAGGVGQLFGLGKSAQANKKYDQYLSGMNRKLDTWYNKEYNTNYLDTDEAKSVLRLLQNQAKEVSGDLESSAAITGASAEKQVAAKDKLNQNYTNAATRLSGYGTQRKDQIQREYMGRKNNLDQMNLQSLASKDQNWSQFGQNSMGLAQNALMMNAMGGGKGGSDWLKKLFSKGGVGELGDAVQLTELFA
jgi:hypothetical protein